ncbi:MAG: DoxX family membrane protein [Chitinophagales bacterium]|nr:DoxX family membrane protein [Chitinophagales bacterium]MBP8755283.1 DoxX family membrane protein [Chitinophagales bacterium]
MNKVLFPTSRILVGCLFIFSGLIKANDPVGFAIKLEEYYELFANAGNAFLFFKSDFIINTVVFQASLICIVEVALGIALLLGLSGRLVAWLLLLMILFFTWLTGYSAITGKVTDCGCFGDAIPLTPWQSFYKDLVLTFLILIIFYNREKIKTLIPKVPAFALFLAATIFTTWVAVTAIRHDVFKDFRPYAIGNNIEELMQIPADSKKGIVQMTYAYQSKESGKIEKVKIRSDKNDYSVLTEYADTTKWSFVERTDKVIEKGFIPKIVDFAVIDLDENDVTEKILNEDDYMFMIVSADLSKTNREVWQSINTMQKAAETDGIFTFGFVSASADDIETFRHANQTAFPFYKGDYKVTLTIMRVNPGIVLLKNGTVIDKWAWRDLPSYQDIKAKYFNERQPHEITFTSESKVELFAEGESVLDKIDGSMEPYNEFFLMDADGNDVTLNVFSDSLPVYMFIVNDITKLSQDVFGKLLPLMQELAANGNKFFVVSQSDFALLQQMKEATKLDYTNLNCDGEVLMKIVPENTGLVILNYGEVVAKYAQSNLPEPGNFRIPQ